MRINPKLRLGLVLLSVLTLFMLCKPTFAADASSPLGLTAIHITPCEHNTQITLELDGTPCYKVFTLPSPTRAVLDLSNAKLKTSLCNINLCNTAVTHIRSGHPKCPGDLRLVFDLNAPLHVSTAVSNCDHATELMITLSNQETAAKTKNNDQHLLIAQQWVQESLSDTKTENTVAKPVKEEQAVKTSEIKKPEPVKETVKVPVKKSSLETTTPCNSDTEPAVATPTMTAPCNGRRIVTVVIDPGHGGKDPGTTGPLGIHEKDVVLAISQNLRDILNRQQGFRAVLTRNRDYFIPLRGRLAIARKNHGDMFVAIHADAYKDPYATGASVFALSAHGASSEAARWLAEKENYSELGSVSLRDKSDILRSVLIDLSQTATISSSMQLGSSLLQQLRRIGNLHYTTVEQAPFMVLKSPDIPSVLVETGFLSNPEEEQRLHNPMAQMEMAKALANGIQNYFMKNPPPGTLIAALCSQRNCNNPS